MHSIWQNMKNRISFPFLMAVLAFALSFIIQIYLNSFVIIARSLPDEIGAIYLASTLAGNDWSYVMTHPALYYGSLNAFIMYPFFRLVHDPLVLYQCLLGIGAFLRSIPAAICFYISYNYLHIDNLKIVFWLSIASTFFTPTRATNIDNEPSLILCCWLLILIIMTLEHTFQKGKKLYLSFLLSLVLCMSLLAHTRAIVYTIAAVFVIFIFHLLTKKKLVNYKIFFGSFPVLYAASKVIIRYWTNILYPIEDATIISNTSESLVANATEGLTKLIGEYGVQSFFDLVLSNLLVVFVFSGGIVIFCLWLFCFHLFGCISDRVKLQRKTEKTSLLFPLMFCIIGIGISIAGLSVTWIDSALNQHINNENLTRGHFYLRYYSNFFGPLLMLLVGYWFSPNNIKPIVDQKVKRIFVLSALTLEVCFYYSWSSFLKTVTDGYPQENSDWFYNFSPFSMNFTAYPDSVQSAAYYMVAMRVALILFGGFYLFYKYKKRCGLVIYALSIFLYQYCYLVLFWDRPFCYGLNYYQSVNATYELRKEYPDLFDQIDEIYYLNPQYGPQYLVQFVLSDIRVILEEPFEKENNIILCSSLDYILDQNINMDGYWYLSLDDNEHLLIKGDKYLSMFNEEKIELNLLTENN